MSQERIKKQLQSISKRPENQLCVDCKMKNPTWASFNLGVFMCMNCAGVHRSLGTHITRIRSIQLDTWDESSVELMSRVGNTIGNSIWEANFPNGGRHLTEFDESHIREKFIRDKYERQLFKATEQQQLQQQQQQYSNNNHASSNGASHVTPNSAQERRAKRLAERAAAGLLTTSPSPSPPTASGVHTSVNLLQSNNSATSQTSSFSFLLENNSANNNSNNNNNGVDLFDGLEIQDKAPTAQTGGFDFLNTSNTTGKTNTQTSNHSLDAISTNSPTSGSLLDMFDGVSITPVADPQRRNSGLGLLGIIDTPTHDPRPRTNSISKHCSVSGCTEKRMFRGYCHNHSNLLNTNANSTHQSSTNSFDHLFKQSPNTAAFMPGPSLQSHPLFPSPHPPQHHHTVHFGQGHPNQTHLSNNMLHTSMPNNNSFFSPVSAPPPQSHASASYDAFGLPTPSAVSYAKTHPQPTFTAPTPTSNKPDAFAAISNIAFSSATSPPAPAVTSTSSFSFM